MRKSRASLTSGPVGKTIIKMTLPMTVGMLGMVFFNIVDTFFVGKLGKIELAAMSFTLPVVSSIISLSVGLGLGASAAISKAIGAGNQKRITRLTTDALILSVIIVAAISTLGYFTIDQTFALLGASDDILPYIREYMEIWYLGTAAIIVPMVGNNIIRATGDTKIPSLVMMISVIINLIFDPLLIFGIGPFPRLELAGAALTTVISRSVTLVFAICILHFREKLISFKIPSFQDVIRSWKEVLYVGVPTASTNMLQPLSTGIITKILSHHGLAAVAAFGVATRIQGLPQILIMALGSVINPFVGQNWGANKFDRTKLGIKYTIQFALIWGILMFAVLSLTSGYFASIFNNDPEVVALVTLYFLIVPVGYGAQNVQRISTSILSILNRPVFSSLLTIFQIFILYIPLAYLGSSLFGLYGIFSSVVISHLVVGSIAYTALKKHIIKAEQEFFNQTDF